MKKLTTILICTLVLSSCAPVNRLTRVSKLPREYSDNYQIEGVKAPKNEIHKTPWIVYSDRGDNAAYLNPGGRIKSQDIGFGDSFLVIGWKGEHLRLIQYKPENIKNNRLTQRKKAEYVGWVHRSKLILSPVSVTDIRSGLKDKMLTAITDTSAVLHPQTYFAQADSIKVFSDPEMEKICGVIGIHEIVYQLKDSPDGRSVLISRTTDITPDKIKEQIVGWVPRVMLQRAGRQLYAETNIADRFLQPETFTYSPIIRPYYTDSTYVFSSGMFVPVVDKSDNKVYNIDGEAISYQQSSEIKERLKHINVVFAVEAGGKLPEQFPILLNVIQNLRPLFSAEGDPFIYKFGAAVATDKEISVISMTSDYAELTDSLTEMTHCVAKDVSKGYQPWSSLRKALSLLEKESPAVNMVIVVGEVGETQENAPQAVVADLKRYNCRVLGVQLYSSAETKYNNFVLQLTNMIEEYARHQTVEKRTITLFADQVCRSNRFRELSDNFYALDYPSASMSQGVIHFPGKEQMYQIEEFAGAIDTLLTQVRADNRRLSESLDRAFVTVGNTKDRYDRHFTQKFNLQADAKPTKEFQKMFDGKAPVWHTEISLVEIPDRSVRYRLMLSQSEFENIQNRLETMCSKEVDVKDISKPNKGKIRKLCQYLEQIENLSDEELEAMKTTAANTLDTVYVSTKKIRSHLQKFYLSEMNTCRVCRVSRRELKRYPLSAAHERIFGVPANNPQLDDFTVGNLRKRRRLSDQELDKLIASFLRSKNRFAKQASDERFSSAGQNYYYIDPKLLP